MGVPFGRRGIPIFIRGTVMSESERRRNYRYNRVLIESERILTPQFDDSIVYLTGPQIEMLRNVTQYLNRLDTYVATHHSGYYLTPDAADYDDILEVVADLEETLMGNPNTIWGYKETAGSAETEVSDTNGTFWMQLDTVPAGEAWRILGLCLYRDDNAQDFVRVQVYRNGGNESLIDLDIDFLYKYFGFPIDIVLSEGQYLIMGFAGSTIGEVCKVTYWGYIMEVP